jgi:hypothetical protein
MHAYLLNNLTVDHSPFNNTSKYLISATEEIFIVKTITQSKYVPAFVHRYDVESDIMEIIMNVGCQNAYWQ